VKIGFVRVAEICLDNTPKKSYNNIKIKLLLFYYNIKKLDIKDIFQKKRCFFMSKKTKDVFVRVVCGVMAGLFILSCVAILAVI